MRDIRTSRRAVMCALAIAPLSAIPAVRAATTDELNGLVCTPAGELSAPAFIDALIAAMRANYVSLVVADDMLHVGFPEPGNGGRPERDDFLDNIDGAQRALYALMCAIPGAIEAVRDSVARRAA